MKKLRTRHVANTCELSGLSWKYRTDATDYINTLGSSRKLLLVWTTRFWNEIFVNAQHVKNTWSWSRNDQKVETDNPQYLPQQMWGQTEGQARADHGPAQQGIRVNLRQEPGSPGTRLKLVTSTKQEFKFENCKTRIPTKNSLENDGKWTRVKQEKRAVKARKHRQQTQKFKKASRMKSKRTK